MDGASALIVVAVGLGALAIYFLPWIIARNREHTNEAAIFFLNLFLGWSLIGWVVAFVWACTSQAAAPAQETPPVPASDIRRPCPFCAEPILQNAIKCKHCGSSLVTNPRDFV